MLAEIALQLQTLPTAAIAGKAWDALGEAILVDSDEEAAAVADEYAPEHLEVQTGRDDWYLANQTNHGSLFVGKQSTVADGDTGVGTNHILPTGRAARSRASSASVWRSAGRWRASPTSSSWTSRCRISTPSCARPCAAN